MEQEHIQKLGRDLVKASINLSDREAGFLVSNYYKLQDNRIRAAAQAREMSKTGEPHQIFNWMFDQFMVMESQIKNALNAYTMSKPIGRWCQSITGIGPVIAAGLIANIDMEKTKSVGALWRFSGADPTSKWEKGKRRPWNPDLKRLNFIIGTCFEKVSGKESDVYGKLYLGRKEYEQAKNERGEYADQANAGAARVHKSTEAYKWYAQGKLPPGHIRMRCIRWTAKLFLAHFWEAYYILTFGKEPPLPYPIAHMGHQDIAPCPNRPEVPKQEP